MKFNLAIGAFAYGILLATTAPAFAQRAETVTPALVFERDACALTPISALATERTRTAEFLGPVLATIFAGFAGDLVKSGVNAAGDALEAASQEHGFVAEGAAGIRFGEIDSGALGGELASFRPKERCVSMYVPGQGDIGKIFNDAALDGRVTLDDDAQLAVLADFAKLGITALPALYVEGAILPGKEGFIFRPTLIWYRSALKGAPKDRTAAELHVTFATPGYDAAKPGIGSGFAGARLTLPRLAPGDLLDWNQLRLSSSTWLPLRPTAGAVDASVQTINTAYALVGTRTAEVAKAERNLRAAERARRNKPGVEADEAVTVAQESLAETQAGLAKARSGVGQRQVQPAGATNVQMRMVVVRDANKFGLAVAKALKSQAEAAGKGVSDGLASKPDWAASDTGYLSAMITVEQKQKLYDDAVVTGDASAITSTGQELRIAKAKANEAAVTAKRVLPYPGVMVGL